MYRSLIAVVAVAALSLAGCETTPGEDGAILGTALGAGLGAIIGNQSGHAGEGALIGAGAGAITGGIIGSEVGQKRRAQQRYNAPPPQPVYNSGTPVQEGHYETRIVRGVNGESYEQRVWVPHHR